MQTNNAHEYTDAQLQAAIDAAFPAGARPEGFNLDNRPSSVDWKLEAPNRLAIARAFLAALPERPQAAEIARLKAHIDHLEERDRQGRDELVQLRTELREARKSEDHWHSEAEVLRAEEAKAQAELAFLRESESIAPSMQLQRLACEKGNKEAIQEVQKYASTLTVDGINGLLQAIQECIPETQPILADDGRSLGQVLYEAGAAVANNTPGQPPCDPWSESEDCHKAAEAAAQAVAAVVTAQAIWRMEAVPIEEFREAWYPTGTVDDGFENVRARLIAAAKGDVPPVVVNEPTLDERQPGLSGESEKQPEPATKEAPDTFEAHGKTWTRHTPGDPMPCEGEAMVYWLLEEEFNDSIPYRNYYCPAKDLGELWSGIIGWCYADEPTPAQAQQADTDQSKDSHTLYQNAMAELRTKRTVLNWTRLQLNKSNDALRVFVSIWTQWPKVSAHQIQEACKNAKVIIGDDGFVEPATFEAHGKTWTRHTPGDPMPCDGEAMVQVILQCELDGLYEYEAGTIRAKAYGWGVETNEIYSIIGWRYADEPAKAEAANTDTEWNEYQQELMSHLPKPWTPEPGDVVRLKSGGPAMTVMDKEENGEFWCLWFDPCGNKEGLDFPAVCLTPAKEGQP